MGVLQDVVRGAEQRAQSEPRVGPLGEQAQARLDPPLWSVPIPYLTQSVFQVVLQKSIPTQIRQLILYIRNSKGWVDRFVRGLTSAKRL